MIRNSILFYPITLEGRRGTTDEFTTIPFHLDLFSAAPGINTIKTHTPLQKPKGKEEYTQTDKRTRKTRAVNRMNSSFLPKQVVIQLL